MICEACKAGFHPECTNPQTCPCQHRRTKHMPDGSVTPLSDRDALLTTTGMMMIEEAEASIHIDRDGDGQTIALEGPVTVGKALTAEDFRRLDEAEREQ
jgi:hypothetical protein